MACHQQRKEATRPNIKAFISFASLMFKVSACGSALEIPEVYKIGSWMNREKHDSINDKAFRVPFCFVLRWNNIISFSAMVKIRTTGIVCSYMYVSVYVCMYVDRRILTSNIQMG